MKQNRKRIIAFLIDIIFVLLLTSIVSTSYTFNPYIYDYEKEYEGYLEIYNEVLNDIQNDSITDEKLDELSLAIYDLDKMNVYYYMYYLIFIIIYFVIFQWLNKGQTIGKKLMNLKVIDYDENNPNIIKFGVRYLFNGSALVMGFHLTLLIKVILLLVDVGHNMYLNMNVILSILGFILEVMLIISIFKSKDEEFLNDRIAKTKVVEVK